MQTTAGLKENITSGKLDKTLAYLYSCDAQGIKEQKERYLKAVEKFESLFGQGRKGEFFSAPGRTELSGNHTDHQNGRVLAAGVNLDVIAVASPNDENIIRIQSEGYPMDTIDLRDLSIQEKEKNKAASLIRGVAARFQQLGHAIGGFDAYTTSNVLKGSGLSSSAAFEVLVGVMINHLYSGQSSHGVEIAQAGQYAENVYFGKPCGLMDQTASAVGGFLTIDFADPAQPIVKRIDFDFSHSGYQLCIINTGGNHADLTDDYASVPTEMRSVAAALGKEVLRQVEPNEFYENMGILREKCSDRALLRAVHFFDDNDRVPKQAEALKNNNFEEFKRLVIQSGRSSFMYLQNVFTCKNPTEQGLSLGLALSEHILQGAGAWRVHGGGFAGTIQAFVPVEMLEEYKAKMEQVFGKNTCYVLSVRPVGGVKVSEELR